MGNRPQKAINRIALSRAITFSGGNAAYIALLALLYGETGSATLVAFGALASFAVPALVSPVAGWIGDRFDRRRVMIASEILGAACFLLMATLAAGPVALLLLRVAASLVAAPLVPAAAAALPGVVGPEDRLSAANAKLAAAGITGGLVGPLIAALLLLAVDPGSVFVFNAVTFLVSAALLLSIDGDFRPTRASEKSGRASELVAGFRYLGRHRLLRPVTMAYGIVFIGVGLTAPAELALSTNFGAGATGFAALACVFALGGIAGAHFGSRGVLRIAGGPTAVLAAASGGLALGFLMVGFSPSFIWALAGMTVAGLADGIWMVAHENLVQRVTPDSIRSRVFAGSEAVYLAGISLGLVGAGGLISALGVANTFKLGAAGSILACLFLVGTATSLPNGPKLDPGRRGSVLVPPSPATAVED